eukprot:g33879.t1
MVFQSQEHVRREPVAIGRRCRRLIRTSCSTTGKRPLLLCALSATSGSLPSERNGKSV